MVGAKIFTAKTMHKRFAPKENKFVYGIYYLAIPLSKLAKLKLLWPLISFRSKDHGNRDGSDLRGWIDEILQKYDVKDVDEVVLIAMPRIFGYTFNPVSFWMCLDASGSLKAVLAEVNNTFGETHSYLCVKEEGASITADDIFSDEKLFHVSPFLPREGGYQFRFDYRDEKLGIWIDYFIDGKKMLATNLIGSFSPLTKPNLLKNFFRFPMLTFKVIALIHYQAFKIILKGIRYIPKPLQKNERLSKVTKM